MTVTVHIGMPRAAANTLQRHYFATCPAINFLGKHSKDADLDSKVRDLALTPEERFDLAAVQVFYSERLAGNTKPVVLSDELLTSWKIRRLEDSGARIREVFPDHQVLYVVQRPTEWAMQFYMYRVTRFPRDIFAGPNPWLEKHMSRFVDGTEVGQVLFTTTLKRFMAGSGAKVGNVLPVEAYTGERRDWFLNEIDEFVGAGGELRSITSTKRTTDFRPASKEQANFVRTLWFLRRDREKFLKLAEFYASYGPQQKQDAYHELVHNWESDPLIWISWFRKMQPHITRAIKKGDEELIKALQLFDDYDIREGLKAHLEEIEAEETRMMLEEFGVDLKPYGYGSATAPAQAGAA